MKRRHRRRLIGKTGTQDAVSETPSPSSRRVSEGDSAGVVEGWMGRRGCARQLIGKTGMWETVEVKRRHGRVEESVRE